MPLKKKYSGTPVRSNYHQDIISNLPQNLRETILTYLPLQDAVRTSVLSKEESALQMESNLIELFRSLPALRVLHFDNHFIQFLAASGVLKRPSLTAVHLNSLKLRRICLEKMREMSCVLFIVRISPNLEDIIIRLFNSTGAADLNPSLESLDVEEYSDVKLDQPRRVKLEGFTGTRNQMALAKLLLTKSPGLMKMIIKPNAEGCDERQGFLILKELIRLQRPSTVAEIIYG
ncbi:unnamed protein product [Cuscuta epithymum]|uniref:F-box domain-containing protein n=1 Tax=Cuscuta epithymum TaxID=186058 RepID=A0AAV0GHU8_9ASTE|nr:unnamed protein product [Cuscuta epithymum]CAH9147551.1 unnamed protein product [Cuscuta epithymum]